MIDTDDGVWREAHRRGPCGCRVNMEAFHDAKTETITAWRCPICDDDRPPDRSGAMSDWNFMFLLFVVVIPVVLMAIVIAGALNDR